VAVDDVTRTVSKTHALLHRADSGWKVTDLASTNGVFLADESEVAGTATVSGVFFLGDARLELLADA
ncbi:FHA domain-containing protein, partial [Microbacterium sp. zg.Y909]|uniref:FHA domain-containing protein n=1 Tax=Microbacterium sp. zg.Y909 TaxID=2969413 RepID=UPI00214C3511